LMIRWCRSSSGTSTSPASPALQINIFWYGNRKHHKTTDIKIFCHYKHVWSFEQLNFIHELFSNTWHKLLPCCVSVPCLKLGGYLGLSFCPA
jgi:hypothetical protein